MTILEDGVTDNGLDPAGRAEEVLGATDVSVELGGLPVLRGISISVHAGETVALLGGNGSGKSTLVRALLGLTPLRRGTVSMFGQPLNRFRDWSAIGYVPQRSTINLTRAKVGEIVGSGRLGHRPPFLPPRAQDRRAVRDALQVVGLEDRINSEMQHLSGGQQQRVLIARALAAEPRLLVLDEPTAGVDLEHQKLLAGVLTELLRRGMAILVVLHEIGPLTPLVDRAVVLREGRVVHDGELPRSSTEFGDHHREHGGHEVDETADPSTSSGPFATDLDPASTQQSARDGGHP
ncbi:metal ABC transporter ATP-binding protein [Microlunatus soli]|uniref:Zinc transport system ATP-binding protein n=1 Tax=Microlunatus soli TaxID=630515 RepID=A0A1H1YUL6_9ACTN|nr:ABC transporter ATP-binding protein [Microlunatus soli]SDT25141.1 zinc transport system ATP-binding protein [Microlunatus soli]